MRIIHLNYSDMEGGAARAAYRIHQSLSRLGLDSHMWVEQSSTGDWTVERVGPSPGLSRVWAAQRRIVAKQLRRRLTTGNAVAHTPALLSSQWTARINASDADIIHLHWVAAEMLSVADIGRIHKPIVWTLHDMWAFCGAEHYTVDHRWRDGYLRDNRPLHESGLDLNRWTWRRKLRHWKRPMRIVAPSRWLAACARESVLMREWPVTVVPNPLDTGRWRPITKELARDVLSLPNDLPLLLFGAIDGGRDPRKGFDLLAGALDLLRHDPKARGLELLVVGQGAPQSPPALSFAVRYFGHLYDDLSLRALYSAADALVVPSRQEAFGQTASEAHACGTPVIAFDTGGLSDIVEDRRSGYLAKPFDIEDFARGIIWVLERRHVKRISEQARAQAVSRFSYPLVAAQYQRVYQEMFERI